MWYNIKVAAQVAAHGHWKLNNKREVQSYKNSMCIGSRTILKQENTTQTKSKIAKSKSSMNKIESATAVLIQWYREFDPGSGWTLAACITHSSRTELFWLILREALRQLSGGRVSNAWATCPCVGDNVWKRTLIPHNVFGLHGLNTKDLLRKDGLASD